MNFISLIIQIFKPIFQIFFFFFFQILKGISPEINPLLWQIWLVIFIGLKFLQLVLNFGFQVHFKRAALDCYAYFFPLSFLCEPTLSSSFMAASIQYFHGTNLNTEVLVQHWQAESLLQNDVGVEKIQSQEWWVT